MYIFFKEVIGMGNKYIKVSIILTNIFLLILFFFTITLPFLVTWYADIMGRSSTLATTVMVTCYPCVPFAATILITLKKLLKTALNGNIFSNESVVYLKNIAICCIVIAVITLVGGNFYLPFLIVGATFSFLSLLLYALRGIVAEQIK